ncbi:Venom carboxylesterase-6 [Folsomia candida]|uniref:Venom carboxylesterase-6 n=1 Tax=Folsomia candida TaxID=158441 RepID=A0A226CWM9_FOLCA|nr:Venom carboxylesterase-6 [Folsomia candida]
MKLVILPIVAVLFLSGSGNGQEGGNVTSSTTVVTTSTTTTTAQQIPQAVASTPATPVVKLGPVVTTKSGQLRPLVLTSRQGREYYAFQGVPFANPPVQFQRFKVPAPVTPWEGVLNATKFAPPCVQYNVLIDEIEGDEDCLYLNIFTPKLQDKSNPGENKFPVMVFIHQGAFMFGSAQDYEAKYMMDSDVILITLAYRLGSFGFLNTEGNMGLKDQLIALQWIQDNIEVFNGEKSLVTIMGESAGAASVHYHILSEKSKGLFSRGISMSGTALSPWAFTRNPRANAIKLATMLNCPTSVMYELFICLQDVNATTLAQKHKDFFEWGTDPIAPFAPSVEVSVEKEGVFIDESPYALMKKGQINDAPWMVGVVEGVCLLDAWSVLADKQLIAEMNVDWHRIAPLAYTYRDTALEPDAVSNQIRAFYFGSKAIGNETATNLTNLYSDRLFNHGMRSALLLHGKNNEAVPLYLYTVAYQGAQSHLKFLHIEEKLGVSEGDELQYLFNMGRFSEIGKGHPDQDFSDKMIKLFVSFAREGKPTGTWSPTEWTQMSLQQVSGDEALMFYQLDKTASFIAEPFADRMSFWDNLPLNELGNEVSSPQRRSDLSASGLSMADLMK